MALESSPMPQLRIRLAVSFCISAISWLHIQSAYADEIIARPTARLTNNQAQDDMCVWVHPTRPDKSLVIASDKSAGAIFVYDLDGRVLQQVAVTKPGNIDLRQRVTLDEKLLDVVVVNQRADGFKLRLFVVDEATRQLKSIDDGDIATGPNYGGCLYHSRKMGRLFFICTSETGTIEQYELTVTNGKAVGRKVRSWTIGKCEGAVADDELAAVYISEEAKGVWRFPAVPDTEPTGSLIASIGRHGLKGDVEGLAILPGAKGQGYLIVSDQGSNRYAVHERQAPHSFVGTFAIEGATQTDGIEICLANLGDRFPQGLFACHTDQSPRPVLLTPWREIGSRLPVKTASTP
jgi:3-phytase